MADFVLVAGNLSTAAWNRLAKKNDYPPGGYLGGKVWNLIIPVLEAAHHRVFAPSLKDERQYNLSNHIEQVCHLIIEHDLKNVILVGASYCGMVITGIANKIPKRIGLLVYLDAVLPESGQSLIDIFLLAKFPYDDKINSPTYKEKLYFDPEKIKSMNKVYVLCTQRSSFAPVTSLAKKKIDDDRQNWNLIELPTSHVPMATHPDELIQLLLNLGKSLKT
jgi:pimeloyl-ACP methyl ester carboxylesterase